MSLLLTSRRPGHCCSDSVTVTVASTAAMREWRTHLDLAAVVACPVGRIAAAAERCVLPWLPERVRHALTAVALAPMARPQAAINAWLTELFHTIADGRDSHVVIEALCIHAVYQCWSPSHGQLPNYPTTQLSNTNLGPDGYGHTAAT